jgi:3-isopropylmalate/(R)-2-methylmalate dehydratase small subunit
MEKFTVVTGIAAPMPMPNINTDAISPMAAGRSTSADLGKLLFANWRYGLDGAELPDFVLNRAPFRDAKIIVAGTNFGCGSSRERAVWALMRFGIRSVIAPSFADIFRENAYQNGLLPVAVDEAACAELARLLESTQEPVVTVDLEQCVVQGPGGWKRTFSVPAERQSALLEGLDEIDVILRLEPAIDAFQQADRARRPWIYLAR